MEAAGIHDATFSIKAGLAITASEAAGLALAHYYVGHVSEGQLQKLVRVRDDHFFGFHRPAPFMALSASRPKNAMSPGLATMNHLDPPAV